MVRLPGGRGTWSAHGVWLAARARACVCCSFFALSGIKDNRGKTGKECVPKQYRSTVNAVLMSLTFDDDDEDDEDDEEDDEDDGKDDGAVRQTRDSSMREQGSSEDSSASEGEEEEEEEEEEDDDDSDSDSDDSDSDDGGVGSADEGAGGTSTVTRAVSVAVVLALVASAAMYWQKQNQ